MPVPAAPRSRADRDLIAAPVKDLSPRQWPFVTFRAGRVEFDRYLYALCTAFATLLVLAVAAQGCAPARERLDPQRGPAVLTAHGEWRDVERSVEVGVRRAEMAVIDVRVAAGEKRFRLETVRGEPGWLVAQPEVDAPFPHDVEIPIRLEASVGLFGNPEAERRLLRAVSERLRDLSGREWAPR